MAVIALVAALTASLQIRAHAAEVGSVANQRGQVAEAAANASPDKLSQENPGIVPRNDSRVWQPKMTDPGGSALSSLWSPRQPDTKSGQYCLPAGIMCPVRRLQCCPGLKCVDVGVAAICE
jgi:hypothetical protein